MTNIFERIERYVDASSVVRNAETYYPERRFGDRAYVAARSTVLNGEVSIANTEWAGAGILAIIAVVSRNPIVKTAALVGARFIAKNALRHECDIADGRHTEQPLTQILSL